MCCACDMCCACAVREMLSRPCTIARGAGLLLLVLLLLLLVAGVRVPAQPPLACERVLVLCGGWALLGGPLPAPSHRRRAAHPVADARTRWQLERAERQRREEQLDNPLEPLLMRMLREYRWTVEV
jgi:hypothetical protein